MLVCKPVCVRDTLVLFSAKHQTLTDAPEKGAASVSGGQHSCGAQALPCLPVPRSLPSLLCVSTVAFITFFLSLLGSL